MSEKKPRVLCLDDQPEGLRVRKIFLEQFGCEVIVVTNAYECLHAATEEKFDIVLLDYHLGPSDTVTGEDVARDLRVCLPRTPLIMLTGDARLPASARESVDAVIIKGTSNPADLLRT